MDPTQFDRVAKLFALRKSRRRALQGGVAGLTVLGGASKLHASSAQDATPEAVSGETGAAAVKPEYLFVQTFAEGTWAAKEGEDGTVMVTLSGVTAQTVFFSDRPERQVGIAQTQIFLDGLGFTPDNPPNAAIVAELDGGEQDVLVLELLDPVYDAAASTLTYDANVLENFSDTSFSSLALISDDQSIPSSFGAGSLFIDDCSDGSGTCYYNDDNGNAVVVGGISNVGCCWGGAENPQCSLCDDDGTSAYYGQLCNESYPDVCTYTDNGVGPAYTCHVTDQSCPGYAG